MILFVFFAILSTIIASINNSKKQEQIANIQAQNEQTIQKSMYC